MWYSCVAKEMYMRDGLHISGKIAAVFVDGLKQVVDSGLGRGSLLGNVDGQGMIVKYG